MPAKLRLLPGGLTSNGEDLPKQGPSVEQIEKELYAQFAAVVAQARTSGALFAVFEKEL